MDIFATIYIHGSFSPFCNRIGFTNENNLFLSVEEVASFYLETLSVLRLQALRSHLREEEYVLDGRGVGHEHCQTVDSHAEA